LVNLDDQRIVAFFVPERGGCAVNAITWKDTGPAAPYASARVRIILKPGQIMQIDGAQPHAIGLLCGADASSLAATAPAGLVAAAVEKDEPPLRRLTTYVFATPSPFLGRAFYIGISCVIVAVSPRP